VRLLLGVISIHYGKKLAFKVMFKTIHTIYRHLCFNDCFTEEPGVASSLFSFLPQCMLERNL